MALYRDTGLNFSKPDDEQVVIRPGDRVEVAFPTGFPQHPAGVLAGSRWYGTVQPDGTILVHRGNA